MRVAFPKPRRRKRIGSRWARPDEGATLAAGFLDRRSWIGRQRNGALYKRLFGRDMMALRETLIARRGRICEACRARITRGMEQLHHILPRGLGGDDRAANLAFLCRACHAACHLKIGGRNGR
jgi:5-methylcytosine-specific restriction endonuclease McrA